MIPPEQLSDVAIDQNTADIVDRDQEDDQAEETTHLQQAQQPDVAEETSRGEEDETKAEDDAVEGIEAQDEDMASWAGQPSIKGSTETMRMILLTFSLIGLQFTWGIEMTYCTPYLLALGLTKSRTSLVWIAGPLSGLIMQPIVGVISDESRSRFGRRRPIMIAGAVLVAISLLVLGWTKEIVRIFIKDKDTAKTCTITLAVLSIYAVDFAINAVQSCSRSLIVDTLPIPKQQLGSAWASRMVAVGHVIGYAAGTVDLVGIFGTTLGDTQFKQLALIAACSLLFTTGVTSWAVTEKALISGRSASKSGGLKIIRHIIQTTWHLPPRIQSICWAQFWSWIGWFPFLFYSSTWVGETYFRYDAPHDVKESKDALGDIGRIGSMALVVFSLVTFSGAFLLPLVIHSPDEEEFTPRPPSSIAGVLLKMSKYKPDLLTAWFYGQFIFSAAMIMAPVAASFRFATAIVALCGIPWVLASWAPATFLGIEVNRMNGPETNGTANGSTYRRLSRDDRVDSIELQRLGSSLHLEDGPQEDMASSGELSGIYFGILNIYTTLPQFVGTFISMIVFAILEPGKSPELAHDADPAEHHGTDGPNAIAVCLFIGALSTLGAAYAIWRLKNL